jgi:hypothetical protein
MLSRQAMQRTDLDYTSALKLLSSTKVLGPSYVIMSGTVRCAFGLHS